MKNKYDVYGGIVFLVFIIIVLVIIWADTAYGFQDATKPNTFAARDTIKATKLNANWDTLYSRVNNLYDSLEYNFIRFKDFRDSTIDSIKVNKIMSNPSIDSIQGLNILRGNPDIDSVQGLNVMRGNPDIDSISGTTKFTGAKTFINAVTFSSTATFDSIYATKIATSAGLITTLDTTFPCSLYDGSTYRATVTARIIQHGKQITYKIPNMNGTISTDSTATIRGTPSKFIPGSTHHTVSSVYNNSTYEIGLIVVPVTGNYLAIRTSAGNNLTPGTGGTGLYSIFVYMID